MSIKRLSSLGLVVGSLAGVTFFAFFRPKLELMLSRPKARPAFDFQGVQIDHYFDQNRQYSVASSRGTIDPASNLIVLSGTRAIFYPIGSSEVVVAAPTASIRFDGSSVRLENADIHFIFNQKPASIRSGWTEWDTRQNTIVSSRGVAATLDGTRIEGDRLTGKFPIMTVKIIGNAKAVME